MSFFNLLTPLSGNNLVINNSTSGSNLLINTYTGTISGSNNTALGVLGGNTVTTGSANIFMGHSVAQSATTLNNCIMIGESSNVQADNLTGAITLGWSATVAADQAIAIGYGASANGGGSVAIGANSTASTANTIILGALAGGLPVGTVGIGTLTPVASFQVVGGFALHTTSPVSYPYTVLSTDYIVQVNTSSARTIHLPSPSSPNNRGQIFVIKDITGSGATNHITIDVTGGANIDGVSTATISTNFGVLRVYSGGTNYFSI